MNARRKRGEYFAIGYSLILGFLIGLALLYASENYTKDELGILRQKALFEARMERMQEKAEANNSDNSVNSVSTSNTVNSSIEMPPPPSPPHQQKQQQKEQSYSVYNQPQPTAHSRSSQTQLQSKSQTQAQPPAPPPTPPVSVSQSGGLLDPIRRSLGQMKVGIEQRWSSRRGDLKNEIDRPQTQQPQRIRDDDDDSTLPTLSSLNSLEPKQTQPPSDTLKVDPPPLDPEIIMRQAEKLNEDHEADKSEMDKERERDLVSNGGQEQEQKNKKTRFGSLYRRPQRRQVIFNPSPALFPGLMVDRSIRDTQVEIVVHGMNEGRVKKPVNK